MSNSPHLSGASIVAGPVIDSTISLDRIHFSTDGNVIIVRSRTGETDFWNARTGKEVTPSGVESFKPHTLTRGTKEGLPIRIEGKIATLLSTGQAFDLRVFDSGYNIFSVSPNGRYLAGGNGSGYLRMLDLERSEWVFLHGHNTSMNNHMHQNSIEYLEFDFRSEHLISLSDEEANPRLWKINDGYEPSSFGEDNFYSLSNSLLVPVPATVVKFSPTRQQILTAAPSWPGLQKKIRTFEYI